MNPDINALGAQARVEESLERLEQQQLVAELQLGRSLLDCKQLSPSAGREVMRQQRISNIRAYELMAQVEFVDRLVASGQLHQDALARFSRAAINELRFNANEAVVQQVCESANEGQCITAKWVKALVAEDRATSSSLPKAVRMGVAAGWIPAKKAAALEHLLIQLPCDWSQAITQPLEGRASAEQTAEATAIARALVKLQHDVGYALPGLQAIDLDAAVVQAMTIDAVRLLADAITAAKQASEAARKLNAAHQRLAKALNPLRAECPQGSALGRVVAQLEGRP